MPKTLEQILGGNPTPTDYAQQFADYSKQLIEQTKNPKWGYYDAKTGTYHSPQPQNTGNLVFTQQGTTGAQTQPEQKQAEATPQMSYADLFVRMNNYRPQTAEEKEAERKRNRRNAVFAAIGDGISALSNLYFTTKGAPNAYTGGSTLTGKMYERQEQLRKERQALDQQYLNAYMNAVKMDEQRDQQERNLRMQLENIAYNRERQAKQDARQARLDQQNIDRYNEEQEYKEKKDKQAQENWEKQFNATQANAAANRAETRRYHDATLNARNVSSIYPLGDEDYEISEKFWKDDEHVDKLYAKLPQAIRDLEEGGRQSKRTGLIVPPLERKLLTRQKKLDVINKYVEENGGYSREMLDYIVRSGGVKRAEYNDSDDYSNYRVKGSGRNYEDFAIPEQ